LAVDVALIAAGLAAGHDVITGHDPRVTAITGGAAIAGGALVIGSFMANAPALIDGGMPGWFPWPVFAAGMILAGWAAAAALLPRAEAQKGKTRRAATE
jgi:hypothetical protein